MSDEYFVTGHGAGATVVGTVIEGWYAWTTPPCWPQPPVGWAPPAGWTPPAEWPVPPADWQWWQPREWAPRPRGWETFLWLAAGFGVFWAPVLARFQCDAAFGNLAGWRVFLLTAAIGAWALFWAAIARGAGRVGPAIGGLVFGFASGCALVMYSFSQW